MFINGFLNLSGLIFMNLWWGIMLFFNLSLLLVINNSFLFLFWCIYLVFPENWWIFFGIDYFVVDNDFCKTVLIVLNHGFRVFADYPIFFDFNFCCNIIFVLRINKVFKIFWIINFKFSSILLMGLSLNTLSGLIHQLSFTGSSFFQQSPVSWILVFLSLCWMIITFNFCELCFFLVVNRFGFLVMLGYFDLIWRFESLFLVFGLVKLGVIYKINLFNGLKLLATFWMVNRFVFLLMLICGLLFGGLFLVSFRRDFMLLFGFNFLFVRINNLFMLINNLLLLINDV